MRETQTMFSDFDIKMMKKAIRLAEKARGRTSPNPLVGAILVSGSEIIGQGYHRKAGEDHAEVVAIKDAEKRGYQVAGSTMYVTLEPCPIQGQTPPCTDLLIQKEIGRVIIGLTDPNPRVNGRGAETLRKAGIEVAAGLLEEEARRQNEIFVKHITKRMPFVAIKIAMSLDGKVATRTYDSRWISSAESRKMVHQLRNQYDCVLTGIGTVLRDDPLLTCRLDTRDRRDPVRAILDSGLKIPLDSRIVQSAGQIRTIIFTAMDADEKKKDVLKRKGVDVVEVEPDEYGLSLGHILKNLYEKGITSILVEAGPRVVTSLLRQNLFDKLLFFVAPLIIGNYDSRPFVKDLNISLVREAKGLLFNKVRRVGADIFIEAYPESKESSRVRGELPDLRETYPEPEEQRS
ncbi:MAG: Riboflavin biosynthesis protein RibD [Actinobacteria bacterium]|nr:Riboflavin biosynthesis protein RibD [Actinomycetota bacterium]